MKLSKLACGLTLALSLCPALSQADQSELTAQKCWELKGRRIDADQIGLPTKGASITVANVHLLPAPHCEVKGIIKPVDPNAPDIKFAANLPQIWDGRALMSGGAGWEGIPPELLLSLTLDKYKDSVTFASDSGHTIDLLKGLLLNDPLGGSFAENDEALKNFAGDSLKKTRDAVNQLIVVAYGKKPDYWYATGGSEGGRQVLILAQRWPEDWDGIVSIVPALNFADMHRAFMKRAQAWRAPGGALGLGELWALNESVKATCDPLDVGFVSNPDACHAAFDPVKATRPAPWPSQGVVPLHCPPKTLSSLLYYCLSDAQIKTVQAMIDPTEFSEKSKFGGRNYPGYIPNKNAAGGLLAQSVMADGYYKFFTAKNRFADYMTVDTLTLSGPYKERFKYLEELLNANPDLSNFFENKDKKKRKLILMHGTGDQTISMLSTRNYYKAVVQAVKEPVAKNGMRYYEIPGLGHQGTFNGLPDSLPALQNWVENGNEPASNQVVSDGARSIPLCEYPTWPEYNGGGLDKMVASSFTCK